VSAHEGVWNFTPVFRGRSLGDITGQVKVLTTPESRWPAPQAPIEGNVQISAKDIGIWGAWVPAGWRLAGEVRATATLGGTFGAPQFTGELAGSGLGVRNLLQGVNVSDGQIAVKLSGETAQIERFTLRGGDGSLSVTGGATFGSAPQARLQFKAERFRVLGRVDRQVIASGNAELTLQSDLTRVDGKFTIDEALFDASRGDAPSLDDDVTVRRAGSPEDQPADTTTAKPRRNFVMNVEIDLGKNMHVKGRGLDTDLGGQLRLSTPGGRLAVGGTINTEAGTYAAYGQKLSIERGILAFSGPADNPRLDVLALRSNIDMRVGVWITGNLLTPRVRLYSEPEMSDTDKLSWLVLGRAPDGLGRNDTALLQRAAVALLAGEGEAPTDALMKSLGIDEISLRQSDGDVRETVISLGKQLSRRWYVGYERGVNSTTGTWQLIYRIAQRFTLRAQSGLENALDVIWTWRAQETPADAGTRKTTVKAP
jgi:translocation and assembly module TamB